MTTITENASDSTIIATVGTAIADPRHPRLQGHQKLVSVAPYALDLQVVVHPTSFNFYQADDGASIEITPVFPAWANVMDAWSKGRTQNWRSVAAALSREIIAQCELGVSSVAVAGRIRTSTAVPVGCWSYDQHGLIINPSQHPAWDNDGDILAMHVPFQGHDWAVIKELTERGEHLNLERLCLEPGTECVSEKWPFTMECENQRYMPLHEVHYQVPADFTPAELRRLSDEFLTRLKTFKTGVTRWSLFLKAYTAAKTGLDYNQCWTQEMIASLTSGMSLDARRAHLLHRRPVEGMEFLSTPLYAKMEGVMKAVRTSGAEVENNSDDRLPYRIPVEDAAFTISTNGWGNAPYGRLTWVRELESLTDHVDRLRNMQWGWELIEDAKKRKERKAPEQRIVHSNLVQGMVDCGLLHFEEVEHESGSVPSLFLTVRNGRGQTVGLEGIKQGAKVHGLVWRVLLPPVLDVAEGKLVNALQHMQKLSDVLQELVYDPLTGAEHWQDIPHACGITGVDTTILNPATGEVVRHLFSGVGPRLRAEGKGGARDASHESYAYRMQQIQHFILQYAGKFGLIMKQREDGTISPPALRIARATVVVDHGHDATEFPDLSFDFFERAQETAGIRLAPSAKGTDRCVRRHALANPKDDRYPIWADPDQNLDPRRCSACISQVTSTTTNAINARVAVFVAQPQFSNVEGQDMCPAQFLVTPAGVELFERQVFNVQNRTTPPDTTCTVIIHGKRITSVIQGVTTRHETVEEALEVCRDWVQATGSLISPQVWERTPIPTLTGRTKLLWISRARRTSAMPKIVNATGAKCVGLHTPSVVTDKGEVIHMLIPAEALIAKGEFQRLMSKAVATECIMHLPQSNERFIAYVTEAKFVATGDAAENTDTRLVRRFVSGINAHLIVAGMDAGNFPDESKEIHARSLETAEVLHSLLRNLPTEEDSPLPTSSEQFDDEHEPEEGWVGEYE